MHTCDDVHVSILCAHTEDDDGDRIDRSRRRGHEVSKQFYRGFGV